MEEVSIGGVDYHCETLEDKIHLQRYNEKYKMWVDLYFPKTTETTEKNKIQTEIIQTLSKMYMERHFSNDFILTEHLTEKHPINKFPAEE